MNQLIDLLWLPARQWEGQARAAFSSVLRDRYPRVHDLSDPRNDEKRFQLRVNADTKDGAIPYAALIAPEQDRSGPYGGMSFALFPPVDGKEPALIGMVVGTLGLAPDEPILGRPGHARKLGAITRWLSTETTAWAKADPTRIDLPLPSRVVSSADVPDGVAKKYGPYLYALVRVPSEDTASARALAGRVLTSLLDLTMLERGIEPNARNKEEAERLRGEWMNLLLPTVTERSVADLLRARRFVVLEGPPGTGKTELAEGVRQHAYSGRGTTRQLHPGTTYESFIGGLAPQTLKGGLGVTFEPKAGALILAARAARDLPTPQRYLLVLDEINRADLAKVLGEAILLFEPGRERRVELPFAFDGQTELVLPDNLDILGTMNTADRSIAILDVAVRRRFAFVPVWPDRGWLRANTTPQLLAAFDAIVEVFVEHAADESFALLPGPSYFVCPPGMDAITCLRTGLRPLLSEYVAQGFVAGFADELRAVLDWAETFVREP